MKKKYIALTMGIVLTASLLTGCSGSTDTDTGYAGQTIYGEVSEVGNDSVAIEIGTQKEMEKPDDSKDAQKAEDTEDSQEKGAPEHPEGMEGGEQPSMLELTGEEKEIKIESDTVITQQPMGMGGGQPGGDMKEAPEKPEGDASDAENKEEAPEKPEGDASDAENKEEAPEQAESTEISLEDISQGDTVSVTFDEDGKAKQISVIASAQGMGQASGVESYDAVKEYTSDAEADGEEIPSEGTDENAVHIYEGATVSLKDLTVSRTSSNSTGGDNSSFYGVGAAILNTEGTAYVSGSKIDTDAAGGAGIFAYGDGVIYASDTEITTKQDTSGGIHAAGGGSLYAWDMTVETDGESSAAVRSDRGGGTMVIDGGTYTSNGTGSPAVYSTADISVNDSELTATGSEAVCIEGLNSLRLFDCDLSGNMSDDSQNDCTWNVILYQSMSGDSKVGNSTFEMNGGTLKAKNGGMFYTTNTESTFTLSDVDITYADDSEFFLQCTGNNNQRGWGTSGQNGAECLFTAIDQEMSGNVIWDSISKLDFYMTDGSTLTGAFVNDETYAGDGGEGYCKIYIDKDSVWTVTGDSTVSEVNCSGTITDEDGKTVTIKGSDGTVYVEGDSGYTVTTESYNDSADTEGASEISAWSDYEIQKPSDF